jgi:hypothetical protein
MNIKTINILLILICVALFFAACNKQNDVEISISDTSSSITVTTPTDATVDAIVTPNVEEPLLTIESYSEYVSFLEYTDLPDQFVSYDMIAQFGAFDSFVCLTDARYGDYSSYMYNLVDVAADDADIVLYVDQDGSTIDTSQQTALKGVNTENMRCLSTEESGAFISNGIEYYYVNGLLLSIKWQVEDTLFTLSGRGLLDGYPQEAVSTPIGNMMNIQSAESVIEAITISIKSER